MVQVNSPGGPSAIRLMLVDDQELFRIGLASLFETVSTVTVVAEADSVTQAIAMARQSRPDVVLMDLRLPDGDGVEACRAILAERPETRVVMLTVDDDEDAVLSSVAAGAAGYLLKTVPPSRLIEAVERVASGASVLDPQVTQTALEFMRRGGNEPGDVLAGLSEQERRIALLVAEGKTNRQIGAELALSPHTVKTYISNMLHKLHLTSRSQVAALVARRATTLAHYPADRDAPAPVIVQTMASDWREWNRTLIEEYRANGGKVSGQFAGAPLLLLTTTGAKSGKPFTTPMMYLADGDRLLVFASKGGAPSHPDWYHNLVAHPRVTLEIGTDKYEADAEVLQGEERARLYARQAELYPNFGEYQTKTSRVIPVVALRRAS